MFNIRSFRPIRLRSILFFFFCCAGAQCLAAETVEVQVEQEDGAYHIYFEILLNAPVERVEEILKDYASFDEMSPSIIESDVVSGASASDATVAVTLKPCVWILCKTMNKVTDVTINAYGAIVYTTLPAQSDFKYGREQVIIKEHKPTGQTRVTYNAKLIPKFFVPPLLGSWLIRKHILRDLKTSNERVEKLASQQ